MLIGFSLGLSALPKLSCSTDRTYKCLGSQLSVFFVFRTAVQEGHHGEPAITRERKHFSKIHESHCKPIYVLSLFTVTLTGAKKWTLLSCSAVDRQNERTNEKTSQNPRRVAHCRVSSLVMVCRRSLANLLATETALLTRRQQSADHKDKVCQVGVTVNTE